MGQGLPFDFEVPVNFFEKAGAEVGKEKRFGGIASIETKDRQKEVLLQRGLDFNDFMQNGWFNDNHSKDTDGILGYPEDVQFFRKGKVLPDGQKAKADGHWVEGYFLDTERAGRIWELGKALQKTNRRLGLSVEGQIQKRSGPQQRTVARALVRNIAITNCPVNADARMDILAKSLSAVEQADPDELEKMLTMGQPADPGSSPAGPKTGEGAGQVLTPESLEHDEDDKQAQLKFVSEKKTKKSLTDTEAFAWLHARLPNATENQIERIVALTRRRKMGNK